MAKEVVEAAKATRARRSAAPPAAPGEKRTLCIDIGGTGLKAMVLSEVGEPLTGRARVETPNPATPDSVVPALLLMVKGLGAFERVSVGFPGVVVDGVTKTAPNLHESWAGFPLQNELSDALKRPVRVLNDAGVQGYGVIEGRGLEMALTLGTGMGCALYIDGVYIPNLELAHHPFRGKKTYEECVGARALERLGKKRWNRMVKRVIEQIDPIWNPRRIYIGGGNAKKLTITLPKHVQRTENIAGLLGGIALWRDLSDRALAARMI